MRNNVQPKQSKPQKENKQVLDLSPFVARAMAEKREAWGDIDKAFGEHPGAFTDALKAARPHLAYYKEQDVETEWYSLKAAAIINLATETTTVRGKKAGAAVAAILKKHWPHIYGYIEKAEEPVDFDKFWIDSNSAIKINRPGKSQILPTGGSLPDKASSWDGRFAVFFYTANVQVKKQPSKSPSMWNFSPITAGKETG